MAQIDRLIGPVTVCNSMHINNTASILNIKRVTERLAGLLSDAEVLEDVGEDFVGGDLGTEDFGEVVETLAKVFGDDVARKAEVESVEGSDYVEVGKVKGLLVADVGDEDFAVGGRGSGLKEL